MIAKAIEALVNLADKPHLHEIVEVDGRKYSGVQRCQIKRPLPQVLGLTTLQGIVDYLRLGDAGSENVFVHVESPTSVAIVERMAADEQRAVYARANPIGLPSFPFGSPLDPETFVLWAQTCFERDDDLHGLLTLASNVTAEKVHTSTDDGVSQVVTVRQGARAHHQAVENPVTLRPFRTFPEISQPQSDYIVRVKLMNDVPTISLSEVKNGQWMAGAIASIAGWLRASYKMPEGVEIVA